MQRGLQTTIHMFESHPNVDKIHFIVVPLAHIVWLTSTDVPSDVFEIIQKYAPGQAICKGVKFDFSLLYHYGNPQLWSVLCLNNVQKQTAILSQLKTNFSYEDFKAVLVDALTSCN